MTKIEPRDVHKECLYPTTRVRTAKAGGSGTVLWSEEVDGEYITYVLTNHHVVAGAITVKKKYNPFLERDMKTETRGTVTVEFFRYKWGTWPIGTTSINADIVAYDEDEDLALLQLRNIDEVEFVAKLPPRDRGKEVQVLDRVWAVGAALGEDPVMTEGLINNMSREIDEKRFILSSAPIIFGNSGGSVYLQDTHEFFGVPSRIAVSQVGFSADPITFLGYFIPLERVYDWLENVYYHFIFDNSVTYEQCERARKRAKDEQQRLVDVQIAQETESQPASTSQYYEG